MPPETRCEPSALRSLKNESHLSMISFDAFSTMVCSSALLTRVRNRSRSTSHSFISWRRSEISAIRAVRKAARSAFSSVWASALTLSRSRSIEALICRLPTNQAPVPLATPDRAAHSAGANSANSPGKSTGTSKALLAPAADDGNGVDTRRDDHGTEFHQHAEFDAVLASGKQLEILAQTPNPRVVDIAVAMFDMAGAGGLRQQNFRGVADDFGSVVAEHQLELGVDGNDNAGFVGDQNRIRHRLGNGPAEGTLAKPRFGVGHGRSGDLAVLGNNFVLLVLMGSARCGCGCRTGGCKPWV